MKTEEEIKTALEVADKIPASEYAAGWIIALKWVLGEKE